jgi:hypothetical protein
VLAQFQAAKFLVGGDERRGWETQRRKDAKTQGREGLEKERKKERKKERERASKRRAPARRAVGCPDRRLLLPQFVKPDTQRKLQSPVAARHRPPNAYWHQ